ncbi:MAG: adenylyl-sulfate kinase [Pseudomonadota bacterium]
MRPAFTVWLTGLPRAGKTTMGRLLCQALELRGLAVEHLDGDELRRELSPDLGFSPQDRRQQALRAAWLAQRLNRHGVVCVVGLVSPQAADRREARRRLGEFVEVFLDCPLEQAMNRDHGGLYQRALAGQVKGLTGLDDPYQAPTDPELRLATHCQSPAQSLAAIMDYLEEAGMLPADDARPAQAAAPVYSPEEERQIKRRLEALGYL